LALTAKHLHEWIISQLATIHMNLAYFNGIDSFGLFSKAAESRTTKLVVHSSTAVLMDDEHGTVEKSTWGAWIFVLTRSKQLKTLKIRQQMPILVLRTAGVVATFWPTLTTLQIHKIRLHELQTVLPLASNLKKLSLGDEALVMPRDEWSKVRKLMEVIAKSLPKLECLVLHKMEPALAVIRQLTQLTRLECIDLAFQEDAELKKSWNQRLLTLVQNAASAEAIQSAVGVMFDEIQTHIPPQLLHWNYAPSYFLLLRYAHAGKFAADYIRAVCQLDSVAEHGISSRTGCALLHGISRSVPAAVPDVIRLLSPRKSALRVLLRYYVPVVRETLEIVPPKTTAKLDAILDPYRALLVTAIAHCASVDDLTATATVFGEKCVLGPLLDIVGLDGVRSMMASEQGQRVLQEKYGIHDIRNYKDKRDHYCIWQYCKTEEDVDFLLSLNTPLRRLWLSHFVHLPRNVRIRILTDAPMIEQPLSLEVSQLKTQEDLDAAVDYFEGVVKQFGLQYANRKWIHTFDFDNRGFCFPLSYAVVAYLYKRGASDSILKWVAELRKAGLDMHGGKVVQFEVKCRSVRRLT
jgi:hypothetical protein